MSSNPMQNNVRPSKKMTSIAHHIVGQISLAKTKVYLKTDLLMFILLNAGWAYMKELEVIGEFSLFNHNRSLYSETGHLSDICYRVFSTDGEMLMSAEFFMIAF